MSRSYLPTDWSRRLAIAFGILLVVVVALPQITKALQPDPVTAAWQRARASGSYRFSSEIVQQTTPSTAVTNVGRSGSTEQVHMEGQSDLRARTLDLRLWSQGGNLLQDANSIEVRVADGKTIVRHGQGAGRNRRA
jgi:hypothetical protein